jgi:hypothetical protein
MDPTAFETLRTNAEALQCAAFAGALPRAAVREDAPAVALHVR